MSRMHPIFSPFALIATGILLIALIGTVYWRGGTLFSPGPLSATMADNPMTEFASHADFAAECARCHAPFAGVDSDRCGACHEIVMDQLADGLGIHGTVGSSECAACHVDHKGSDYDITATALEQFGAADHAHLFVLDGAHESVACESCHVTAAYGEVGSSCVDCHAEPEIHQGQFGNDCLHCHTTAGWEDGGLRVHPFPLDHGVGSEIPCRSCHVAELTSYSCSSCHEHQAGIIIAQHKSVEIGDTPLSSCASCHLAGEIEADR